MTAITCDGRSLEAPERQSLLDTLLAAGVALSHSCRAGACQSCLVKAVDGPAPPGSQSGLKPTLVEQGFFLACQARPVEGLSIATGAVAELSRPAVITAVASLGVDVLQVLVEPLTPFEHRAGQYVTLVREDGLARSYSIASLPGEGRLELHVRVLPHGRMSGWLATVAPGTRVSLRGPAGNCFYVSGRTEQTLVLAGTGTGLAPLWGIAHDALRHGHTGPIRILHGARVSEGLYLTGPLAALSAERANVEYSACVLESADPGMLRGSLDDVLLERTQSWADHRVFLCGDPDIVQRMKRRVFLAGAKLSDIHADPFIVAPDIKGGAARDRRETLETIQALTPACPQSRVTQTPPELVERSSKE